MFDFKNDTVTQITNIYIEMDTSFTKINKSKPSDCISENLK